MEKYNATSLNTWILLIEIWTTDGYG